MRGPDSGETAGAPDASRSARVQPPGVPAGPGRGSASDRTVPNWAAQGLAALAAVIAVALIALTDVGAVVVVLGAVSGKVLSAMGFGASGTPGS
jgi:hypothetical protein